MAMRCSVLAALAAPAADGAFEERVGAASDACGPWRVALRSVWELDEREAGWRMALHTRAADGVGLRATTVDDAFVRVELFRSGAPVLRFEHPFGGFSDGFWRGFFVGREDGEDPDAEPRDLTRPLPPEVRRGLRVELGEDAELVARLAAGSSPREAGLAVARARAARIGEVLPGADVAEIERILVGAEDGSEHDDGAWADVPELLEAFGLRGFRAMLASFEAAEDADEPADVDTDDAGGRSRGPVAVRVFFTLCVIGGVAGGVEAGFLGAIGGFLALPLLVIALLIVKLVVSIGRFRRSVKELVDADSTDADLRERVPPADLVRAEPLLSGWRDLDERLKGGARRGGFFGALYPEIGLAGDPVSRRLLERAVEDDLPRDFQETVRDLNLQLVDAELSGASTASIRAEFERLEAAL